MCGESPRIARGQQLAQSQPEGEAAVCTCCESSAARRVASLTERRCLPVVAPDTQGVIAVRLLHSYDDAFSVRLTAPFSRLPTPPPSISSLSDFFPTVVMFLRKLPVVGPILNMPGVKNVVNKIAPKGSLPM